MSTYFHILLQAYWNFMSKFSNRHTFRREAHFIKCMNTFQTIRNTALETIISILNAKEMPIDFTNRSRLRQASFILSVKIIRNKYR